MKIYRSLAIAFSCLYSCLMTTSAFAEWDYQAGLSARSVPLAAIVSGSLGYGYLLWGENPLPKLPPIGSATNGAPVWKYGYIRPNVTAQTIGLTNRATAELEVSPISPIAFAIGQGYHGKINYSGQFDCTLVACGSLLSRTFARAQLVLGAGGFFGGLFVRQDWISHTTTDRPFVEESATLLGAPGSDRLQSGTLALGYTISPKWMVGANYTIQRFDISGTSNANAFGWVNHIYNQWGFLLGAGSYVSTHQGLSPTIIGMVQVVGARALSLL